MTETINLDELEKRVGEKFTQAWKDCPQRMILGEAFNPDHWSDNLSDEWAGVTTEPEPVPQLPREQWVTYPNRRAIALTICETWIDKGWDLSDPTFMFCYLYGGRERIA